MSILNKVLAAPNTCQVSLFFSGTPSAPKYSQDAYYGTQINDVIPSEIYASYGSIKFTESGKDIRAGFVYTQTLEFSMPTTDELRAKRIDQFKKVKFIKITLTSGQELFFGKNDFNQNARPKAKVASSEKLTQIQYTQVSMMPIGFITNETFLFQDGIQFIFQDETPFN